MKQATGVSIVATYLGALEYLYETVHMWAAHVNAHKFRSSVQEWFVPGACRLGEYGVVHAVLRESRTGDNDCTHRRRRKWDMPQECRINGGVKAFRSLESVNDQNTRVLQNGLTFS